MWFSSLAAIFLLRSKSISEQKTSPMKNPIPRPSCRKTALAAGLLVLFGGLGAAVQAQTPVPAVTAPATGLDLDSLDTRVKPGDDFYRYANGHWLDAAVIPSDQDQYGPGHQDRQGNLNLLHILAEQAADDRNAKPDSPEGRVGSFYRSGMDEAQADAGGAAPLFPELTRIESVHDLPSLETEIGHLHRLLVFAGFNVCVSPDPANSAQEMLELSQGGLGLPACGYYLRSDTEAQTLQAAYVAHTAKMLTLLGESPAQSGAEAQTILAMETRLAQASKAPENLRDVRQNYHRITLPGLNALTPGMDWRPYFQGIGLPDPGAMSVDQPRFFTALGQALATMPLADWKAYLRWNLASAEAPRLSNALVEENFHFYGTVLSGIPQLPPRWKRVLVMTDRALGDDLGQLYVARAFPPEAKARALLMAQTLKATFREDLVRLPWIGDATRRQALAKLDAMTIKIGYPDRWRDYSRLNVTSASYAVNGMRADEFEFQRNLNKIGKPFDRLAWDLTASTTDAYYNRQMNDLTFPAGILQPPYFSLDAEDAVNFGAIGTVMGHEMTHGFDDQGRRFDAQGNLNDWWTAEDSPNFEIRAQGIVAQYEAYELQPGLHVNGKLTLGENIADIGGLKIAYLALEASLSGKPRAELAGFTPEQRFFLSFAQSRQRVTRPEQERFLLATDPHAPSRFRVLGPLADLPEFRQAFGGSSALADSLAAIW